MQIIRDEGLRGVRHRAVAEKAGVPLAATTYYFKDINELIVDSFVYFMELNISQQNRIFDAVAEDFSEDNVKSITVQEKQQHFHQLFYTYLNQQISDKTSRIIERSFAQYASRIPDLAANILQLQEYFEQQIAQILKLLNVKQSIYKAHVILAFINITEERALLSGKINKDTLSANIQLLVEDIFT